MDETTENSKPDIENSKPDYLCDEEVQRLLQEFRRTVQDILEPRHHDKFLYRWLKARDFDIPKAEKMIRESFKFRKKHAIDAILTPAYSLPEVFVKYKGMTTRLGFDHENSPVRLYMFGLNDCKGFLDSLPVIECCKLYFYQIESDLQAMEERGYPDAKITFIFDFQQFSLKNFYHKSVLTTAVTFTKMYQDNYPEVMKVLYLINVPSFFNWIFSVFKPILNQNTMSKIRIYKEGEHVEEFRRIMDPKILPAFLGGDLTDPDGNPKCHTVIDWDQKVDPSFFMKHKIQSLTEDPSLKTKVIPSRSTFQIPLKIHTLGSILKWKFVTKDCSIYFGLLYKSDDNQSNLDEILPIEIVECHLVAEDNEYVCDKTGTYILHFDNTHSWVKSKELRYKVEVLKINASQPVSDL